MPIESPLLNASTISKTDGKKKKNLVATVMLTSLVDAFSILVIYLLVGFSNSGEILYLSKGMELPAASHSSALKRKTLVKIEKDKFFIEDAEVNMGSLVSKLVEIRKELASLKVLEEDIALTVQADKKIKYELLNNVIRAGGHAGFSNIQFAVLTE